MRWSYGWTVTAATAALYVLAAGPVALGWSQFRKAWTIFFNGLIADLESAEATAQSETMIEVWRQVDTHLPNVFFGMFFGMVLLGVAVTVWLVFRWLRRSGAAETTRFRDARTPEWLVWAAIAVALLWFVDQRWHTPVLRFAVWNSAIALVFVYWLNGLSAVVYALLAFQTRPIVWGLVLVTALYLGLFPLLSAVGFFDTWSDFRGRCDRILEARRAQSEDEGKNE